MGKLRTSLSSLSRDLDSVRKTAEEAGSKYEKLASNGWQIMQMSAAGIDETFLYINEKLKKRKLKIADVKDETIKDFEDAKVKKFIKGVDDGRKQAIAMHKQWDQVGQDLDRELRALDKAVADINSQLAKKKKKLIKTKKYKQKIKIYENWLSGLTKQLAELKQLAKQAARDSSPPSEAKISKVLDISMKSTIAELDRAAGIEVKNLLRKYSDHKKEGSEHKRKLRVAGDFRGELKTLRQWVDEADDMDEEEKSVS